MFSGIVETIGKVDSFEQSDKGAVLKIRSKAVTSGYDALAVSDSISVSGACLTVVELESDTFTVEVAPETLRKTWFSGLCSGMNVNLERALKYGQRVGGHLVQGHIDETAHILGVKDDGDSKLVEVGCSQNTMRHVVEKGFVALDGVSLTCFGCDEDRFRFTLIPFTAKHTTLGGLTVGAQVNIETDMTAKYVERSIAHFKDEGTV